MIIMLITLIMVTSLSWSPIPNDWDKLDTALSAVFVVESVYDVMSTRWCLDRKLCYEGSPLLGKYPSAGKLWTAGVLTIAGSLVVAAVVPAPYRKIVLVALPSIELLNLLTEPSVKFAWHVSF